MPIIRCRMSDCVNWDDEYCSAARISIDDEGVCLTYSAYEEVVADFEDEAGWDEDEEEEEDELADVDESFDDDDVVIRGRRRWNDW